MNKTLFFAIALVFCFGICVISAKERSEVDLTISELEATNHKPVDTAVNKNFHFNGSELEVDRADACKCKNGKCMRVCDVEKTTPCTDERKVCVCNPEFGEKDEGVCEYCNCGQGFNCSFTYWSSRGEWVKDCACPKGYHEDTRVKRCAATCSDERPCQNGGICTNSRVLPRSFTCRCLRGTSGALCEEIQGCSECRNRLEVDCLYDQKKETSYCSCKNSSVFYDYDQKICKPCPCVNGVCEYEVSYSHKELKCHCFSGYKLFNGYCKKCECDFRAIGGCQFDSQGERICRCPDGFYERNGLCLMCSCTMWSDMDTKCEMIGNMKRCFCREGFQEINQRCEDINECKTNNPCHPSASCYNTVGAFYCECPDGYRGYNSTIVQPGEVCYDIDECKEKPSLCWYGDYVKCVNVPGWYKCECLQGYKPITYSSEPSKTSCAKASKHWGPAVIVICITILLIAGLLLVHKRLKSRAARST